MTNRNNYLKQKELTLAAVLGREEETKANLYTVRALGGVLAAVFVCFVLNEAGVFEVNKTFMRAGFFSSLIEYLAVLRFSRKPKVLSSLKCKYWLLGAFLLFAGVINVLLSGYSAILIVLPLLLATQYRSMLFAHISLAGACFLALAAPVAAFFLGTYNYGYLSGYLETVCRVTVTTSGAPLFTDGHAAGRILLYLGLPQVISLCGLGVILFSAVRHRTETFEARLEIAVLNRRLVEQMKRLSDTQDDALAALADIIESRDENTGGHVHRASEIVRILAETMLEDPSSGMTKELAASMEKGAPLHDLGKVSIDDTILKKPGPLTGEEWKLVKQHPGRSADIIRQTFKEMEGSEFLRVSVNMALYHHERMDGKGYPEGLRGNAIPLESRVMALADVFDAVLSKRSYKEAVPFDEAFEIVHSEMPDHLDASLYIYLERAKERIRRQYV